MPKRRGGQSSEKARKGSAEPDAEHSGSEDEPPLVTPYTRLVEAEAQTAAPKRLDAEAPTPGKADSVWAAVQSIPGYHPKNEKDRVMLSRAAMHEHQIVLQCAKCKAGTLVEVIIVVALCAPRTFGAVGVHRDVVEHGAKRVLRRTPSRRAPRPIR